MATRLYAYNSAPSISPAVEPYWTDTSSFIRRELTTTKISGPGRIATFDGSFDNALIYQLVSEPLAAQDIDGLFNGEINCASLLGGSGVFVDLKTTIIVKVVSEDGLTLRGILYSGGLDSTTWSSSIIYDQRQISVTTTPLSTSENDRLVIEIGVRRISPASVEYGAMLYLTTSGSDIPPGNNTGSSAGQVTWYNGSGWTNGSATSAAGISVKGFRPECTVSGRAFGQSILYAVIWIATAEL
jgi:hypothetical protein